MLVQAGHPHPVLMRRDGRVEPVGNGGMPIGLIPGVTFERVELQLHPGDRLFLVSDGVTECPDAQEQELGAEGLNDFLRANADLEPAALLDALVWHLSARTDTPDFPDDVSGVLLHYRG